MKVAVLVVEFGWAEAQLQHLLELRGCKITLFHVLKQSVQSLLEQVPRHQMVINRVRPSHATRFPKIDITSILELLERCEERGIRVVGTADASRADYDKHFAATSMRRYGVSTPITFRVNTYEEALAVASGIGYPLIIKPQLGGGGTGVQRIMDAQGLKQATFGEGQLLQEYVEASIAFDYRICVCRGKVLFANARTLIDGWFGSRSQGSRIHPIKRLPSAVEQLALRATEAIGAEINSLDICLTRNGPVVIENNPTPYFSEEYMYVLGFNPIARIVDELMGMSEKRGRTRVEKRRVPMIGHMEWLPQQTAS